MPCGGFRLFPRLKFANLAAHGPHRPGADRCRAERRHGQLRTVGEKYLPRVFATARRYARRDSEVEDIVQEVWSKAFLKLSSFRGEAPFEHWLMRLAVHTCYDFLRAHQRNRETSFTELSDAETGWLDRYVADPDAASESAAAAKQLVARLMEMLSPPARLIITLLEIEDKSVKEISALTGWSGPLVKVRAFRARAEMRKCLAKITRDSYL